MGRASSPEPAKPPHVVILGGGFAGLYAAVGLGRAPVRVTLIDRRNHHLFQPLLYQVATASLSPADIAAPIRHVLARQRNTSVMLGEAERIEAEACRVVLKDGERITYDRLVVATGVTHSYFGHDEWEAAAPGLKDIPDALEIRERFLVAFEAAEREEDAAARRAQLTFIVVGGGPTGVELAGAMAEIARRGIHRDFRRIDTTTARVILVEGQERVLPTFPPDLSRRAKEDLERLGVDVWVGTRVTGVDSAGVTIGEERIAARSVFWAAGVEASPLGRTLGAEVDRLGRVIVGPDLSVPGRPEVFVVGDLAHVKDDDRGGEVPGVAPAAMQMGRFVARVIAAEASCPGGVAPARPRFSYRDKGMLATIGRMKAVGTIGRMKVSGILAWWMWLLIHLMYLIGFRNRILVLTQWAWAFWTFQRGARLITGERGGARVPVSAPGTSGAAPIVPAGRRS